MNTPDCEGKLRIRVIGVCYYLRLKEFERRVDSFIANLGWGISVDRVFLSIRHDQVADIKPWIMPRGNLLDISAYATGADITTSFDLYIFLNDTLFLRHPWKTLALRFASLRCALASAPKPSAVGEVHTSTDLLMLDTENPTRAHLSTFCFMLNRSAFMILGEIVQTLPNGNSTDSMMNWLNGFTLNNSAIKNLLYVHLTARATPWSWKGLTKLPPQDLILRKKVTVLFEYLLTTRILQSGGFVMPVNYGVLYRIRAKLSAFIARLITQ